MDIFAAGMVVGVVAAILANRFIQNSKVPLPTKSADNTELAEDLIGAWKRTRPKIEAEFKRLQSDLTAAKAENEALRGRVAEAEHLQKVYVLRKQAEAMERAKAKVDANAFNRVEALNMLGSYISELHKAADELEAGGGDG